MNVFNEVTVFAQKVRMFYYIFKIGKIFIGISSVKVEFEVVVRAHGKIHQIFLFLSIK